MWTISNPGPVPHFIANNFLACVPGILDGYEPYLVSPLEAASGSHCIVTSDNFMGAKTRLRTERPALA